MLEAMAISAFSLLRFLRHRTASIADPRTSIGIPPGWYVAEGRQLRLAGPNRLHLYAVELTNFCNLKCSYCVHPTMRRPKGHISAEVLDRCIAIAKAVGQDRLVLHHIGEPLLHPKLEERLLQVKAAGLTIQFSTNGVLLERLLPTLIGLDTAIDITLSVHLWHDVRSTEYFAALKEWQNRVQETKINITQAFNIDEKGEYGFTEWTNYEYRDWDFKEKCFFLKDNWGVVLWNGDVVSCCLNGESDESFGNIMDPKAEFLRSVPWKGCNTCPQWASGWTPSE
jgi:sulfatase maturation enzyme AslB (radical SAM superfamily)